MTHPMLAEPQRNWTLSGYDMDEADRMPGYLEFFQKTWMSFQEFGFDFEKYPYDHEFTKKMLWSMRGRDVVLALLIAVVITLFRYFLTAFVFNPVTHWAQLLPCNIRKFPESAFRFLSFSFLWFYSLYVVVLSGNNDFFYRPCRIWFVDAFFNDDYLTMELPNDIYWLYLFQLGFYIHSTFATIFIDIWRKDSFLMIFHHIIAIFTIEFTFLMKFHRIGALCIFLHDINDIILEFTKINVYLKYQGGKIFKIYDTISAIGLVSFAISWAWFRLYWFPLKVIHSTNWGVYVHQIGRDPKMYLILNVILLILQILHIYWFWLIVSLLIRIILGRVDTIEDTREYEEHEQMQTLLKKQQHELMEREEAQHQLKYDSNHKKIN